MAHHFTFTLYDQAGIASAICSDDDGRIERQPNDHLPFLDLNLLNQADKTYSVSFEPGPDYRAGDHVHLLDWRTSSGYGTDTVSLDPLPFGRPIQLSEIMHGGRGFQERAALIRFIYWPSPSVAGSQYRLDLWDMQTAPNPPTLFLYNWQSALMPTNMLAFFNFAGQARLAWMREVTGTGNTAGAAEIFDGATASTLPCSPDIVDLDKLTDGQGKPWVDRVRSVQIEALR